MNRVFNAALGLCCSVACSQNCQNTLSGHIIDLHDQTTLSDATIIVAGAETAVKSNENGLFQINGLCEATYTLQVSHPSCETQVVRVLVRGNTERTINMEHHLEELGEIAITSSGNKNISKTGQEQQVSTTALQVNAAGSLGDALKGLSGVSSLNTGNTVVKPVIQGLHSSRVVLVTDGTRLQDQEWGVEHAPNIDINNAGSVSVVKGASALQYGGDAIGGTIIIKPVRVPQADSLYGSTLLTGATNGRGGGITSTLIKSYNSGWYGSIQGTLKRFGDFETPDYVLSNTGAYERDAAIRIGVNKFSHGIEASYSIYNNELGILRASHVGSAADLANAISNTGIPNFTEDFTYEINSPKQEIKHQTAKLTAFKRFNDLGKLSFQYDYQKNNRLEFDIRRDSDDLRPAIDLELRTHSATLDFDYTADNTIVAKAGILGRAQTNFPDPTTGIRRLIPDYDRVDFGAYFLGAKTLDNWTLEGGMRYDFNFIDAQKFYRTSFWENRGYDVLFPELVVEDLGTQLLVNPEFTFHSISATAGAGYDFNELYSLTFNYSLSNRAPNPSELFSDGLHQSAARIELGDIRFDKETSNKVSVALSRKHKNWSFTIAPFGNFISDFILIEPTGSQQTLRGNFPVWEYRQTNARLLGVDIDNSFTINEHLTMTNQLSIVKGQDVTLDLPLINIPPVNTTNRVTYTNEKWYNFNFWIESQYVFRQNEFPDTNFDVFIVETDENILVDVSTPPEAYHLLNLRGKVDFSLNTKSKLEVALAVNNLFDTSYRNYLNRQRFFADDLGRNLSLQCKINY
jgi:iron complex outermembrane receptor protein